MQFDPCVVFFLCVIVWVSEWMCKCCIVCKFRESISSLFQFRMRWVKKKMKNAIHKPFLLSHSFFFSLLLSMWFTSLWLHLSGSTDGKSRHALKSTFVNVQQQYHPSTSYIAETEIEKDRGSKREQTKTKSEWQEMEYMSSSLSSIREQERLKNAQFIFHKSYIPHAVSCSKHVWLLSHGILHHGTDFKRSARRDNNKIEWALTNVWVVYCWCICHCCCCCYVFLFCSRHSFSSILCYRIIQ